MILCTRPYKELAALQVRRTDLAVRRWKSPELQRAMRRSNAEAVRGGEDPTKWCEAQQVMSSLNPADRTPGWTDRLLPRCLIVTFHGLGTPTRAIDADEVPYWVPPEALGETIGFARRGEVEITFDDGYSTDHHMACPLLLEAGLSARFFVLAGRLDQPGCLSRNEVADMAAMGMTIGNHGYDHLDWTKASDAQMRRELHDARKAIEDCLGVEVDSASIPFGSFDRRVLRLVAEAGYRRVYTSSETLAHRAGWLMPRHTVKQATVVGRDLPRWRSLRASIASALRNVLRGYKYGFSTSTAGPVR